MLTNSVIEIFCSSPALQEAALRCSEACGVKLNEPLPHASYRLHFADSGTALEAADGKKHGRIQVDFCGGKNAHRRRFGGGKGQLIAKACGIKGQLRPRVLDATAGLGQDAFVLACLGCPVLMMERSPIAFALLRDGLERASVFARGEDPELRQVIERLELLPGDSISLLRETGSARADVIYLDPMFPDSQKSAAVNKNMQAFHTLIGKDHDEAELLEAALSHGAKRVVVKRPRLAPAVPGPAPSFKLEGKSSRYDVYALQKMT